MKTKSGDFVLPGDALGVTEEFVPSEWTYEDEGRIRSLVAGTVSVDNKNKKISIIPKTSSPSMLRTWGGCCWTGIRCERSKSPY